MLQGKHVPSTNVNISEEAGEEDGANPKTVEAQVEDKKQLQPEAQSSYTECNSTIE